MGEIGEDGLRLHEDQEPYRLLREMERHPQHEGDNDRGFARTSGARPIDRRTCQVRVCAGW